jgi:hypothetical protein
MINDSPTVLEAFAAEFDPVDPHAASSKIATVIAPVQNGRIRSKAGVIFSHG